jgi:predicted nucleotidyltransferase
LDAHYILNQLVDLFRVELSNNLVGVYLHGSLAMGCYNQNKSDIDLLIVAQHKLSTENSKHIAQQILKLQDSLPSESRLEISIILESYLKDFVYPTPFEFHYSDFHRMNYKNDENYLCGGFEDSDLAAHIVVIYHRGVTLYGKDIREVFYPIEQHFYVDSILSDVENASENIIESPLYYTLNLCRVLYFLKEGVVSSKKEGVVSSKKEGGEWGIQVLPSQYRQHIQYFLDEYAETGAHSNHFEVNPILLKGFSDYMLSEIKKTIKN